MKEIKLEETLISDIESKKISIQRSLIKWGQQHHRYFPWREKRTPYLVLVSEILLKRTTASAAKRIYEEFMSLYPDIETLAMADRRKLEKFLSTIGYHKRRARILIEIAKYILKNYAGKIPRSETDLLEIPYVGHYTTNAILSLGYGIPSAMVDSNIERIIKRVFLKHLRKPSSKIVQKIADMLSPMENNQEYNYALLDFGALVCRYGMPKCKACPINKLCDYYLLGNPFSD